jgi:hypothetical protein
LETCPCESELIDIARKTIKITSDVAATLLFPIGYFPPRKIADGDRFRR